MIKFLRERIRIIYKYIYVIIFFTLAVGVGTFYYVSNIPGYYESKSILLVSSANENDINNFIIHLKSNDLIGEVKELSKVSYSVEELKDLIFISNIKDTDLLELSVHTENKDEAKAVLDSLITTFSTKASSFYINSNIKVIESSSISTSKEFLDANLYTAIACAATLILMSFISASFGSLDVDIKNHEDLKKHLNMKSLGIVPNNELDDENNTKKKKKTGSVDLKIINDPSSVISESYRMIRTNLDFLDLRVINFTSTTSGEGKSEVISNVALAFSMIGKKVLIIDCDLRKPVIHKNFAVNRSLGLSDIVLYNRIDEYKNMVQTFKINNEQRIDILSAGSKIYNPSELLNSNRFKNLIIKAREDYDLILIDCPPISLMTDAVIVSKISDGTAYIIEYNRTNHAAIQSCVDQLNDVNAFVLGGIITKVNIRKQKKLYGNKYDYYYSNYM